MYPPPQKKKCSLTKKNNAYKKIKEKKNYLQGLCDTNKSLQSLQYSTYNAKELKQYKVELHVTMQGLQATLRGDNKGQVAR